MGDGWYCDDSNVCDLDPGQILSILRTNPSAVQRSITGRTKRPVVTYHYV